jgi:hypothetical protein
VRFLPGLREPRPYLCGLNLPIGGWRFQVREQNLFGEPEVPGRVKIRRYGGDWCGSVDGPDDLDGRCRLPRSAVPDDQSRKGERDSEEPDDRDPAMLSCVDDGWVQRVLLLVEWPMV